MSAVITSLGRVLRRVQLSPPSFETKIGAVALADPPGLGVKAEAARSFGSESYSARKGSASCQVSPLSDSGITSTTRTPACLPGGAPRLGASQAAHRATAAVITLIRMSWEYRGRIRGRTSPPGRLGSARRFPREPGAAPHPRARAGSRARPACAARPRRRRTRRAPASRVQAARRVHGALRQQPLHLELETGDGVDLQGQLLRVEQDAQIIPCPRLERR